MAKIEHLDWPLDHVACLFPKFFSKAYFTSSRSRINEAATRLDADMAERHGRSERRGQIGHVVSHWLHSHIETTHTCNQPTVSHAYTLMPLLLKGSTSTVASVGQVAQVSQCVEFQYLF